MSSYCPWDKFTELESELATQANGRTHSAPYCGHGYVPLRCGGGGTSL